MATDYSCAGCHNRATSSPDQRLEPWGTVENTPEGWHEAVVTLAAKEIVNGASNTLLTHFNGSDAVHGERPTAFAAMQEWLDVFVAEGGDACAGDINDGGVVVEPEPVPEPIPEPVPEPEPEPEPICEDPWEAAVQSNFFATNLDTQFFACSGCHRGGPSGGDLAYNATESYSVALAAIDSESPIQSTLGQIFEIPGAAAYIMPNGNVHPPFSVGDVELQDNATLFVNQSILGIARDTPECVEVELCDITPQQSETMFNDTLFDAFDTCSFCHRSVPSPTNGDLQFPITASYAIAIERLDATLAPSATVIGQLLHVDNANFPNHAYPFTESAAAKVWIEANIDGVPCE